MATAAPSTATSPPPASQPAPARHQVDAQIVLDGVSRRFGNVIAVDNVSLQAFAGRVLGLIGPSGSGKTTTIRLISGALSPDRGRVRVMGEDPRHFRRRTRERIGYMPQLFVLYPDLTARENIDMMAALFGLLPITRRRRVSEVLKLVELWDARNRLASDMSGGMQRRLELACALVHEPSLLILDEPTAGIDPLLRNRVWDELHRLRGLGVTILVTTQYVTEAEYCDSVAIISEGQLAAYASPGELRRLALGGDVIEIGTRAPFDVRALQPIEGVVAVRQTGPARFLVVAQDAGLASPKVDDAVDEAGAEIEYSREYRPNFDEVFTALVTAHSQRDRAEGGVMSELPVLTMRPR